MEKILIKSPPISCHRLCKMLCFYMGFFGCTNSSIKLLKFHRKLLVGAIYESHGPAASTPSKSKTVQSINHFLVDTRHRSSPDTVEVSFFFSCTWEVGSAHQLANSQFQWLLSINESLRDGEDCTVTTMVVISHAFFYPRNQTMPKTIPFFG